MAEENIPQRYPKRNRKQVDKEFSPSVWHNPKRWTPKEKDLLLSALKKYGDHDVSLLAAKVRTKSPAHVHSYLTLHKQASAEESNPGRTERLERLHKWLEHIMSKKQKNPSPNPAALSMLMIALLEDHPVPTDGEVNFTEAYIYMFELLSGRHTARWQKDSMSEQTLLFIKLTILKLMKSASKHMGHFQMRLAESANSANLFADQKYEHLPEPTRRLVLLKHHNPLRLNEQCTELGVLSGS